MSAEEAINNSLQLNLNKELYTQTDCHFRGVLSPKSKHLLTLPTRERTGDAAAFSSLLAEMENLKFFKMFSNRTKESLAKNLQFVAHRADEFLLVQGVVDQPQQALYFLLSGVVSERYSLPPTDDSDAPTTLWPEKILRKGEFFGHVDIVRGRPPTVDALTICYSELLMLSKKDFGMVREEMESHTSRVSHRLQVTAAIGRFGWTDIEYHALEIYSKLRTYVRDEEVYSGVLDSKPPWAHFVVMGECKVLRELTYYVTESGQMRVVPYQLRKELVSTKQFTERLEFEQAKQGYYFAVGERFSENHVIASSTLECLLIPRLLLVFKNRQLLQAMAKDLEDSLPSDQEVLDSYSKLVDATRKKVEMVKDLLKHKPERLIKK